MTLLLGVSLARKCCHFQQYSQSAHFHPAWSPDDDDGDGGSGNDDEDSGGGNSDYDDMMKCGLFTS